jgi:hypothetical protein
MTEKNNEERILFPEAKIGDIVVKPWSFGVLFEISSMLEVVLDKMEEKKIDIDNTGFLSYATIAKLFTIASPQLLKIISLTIEKDIEDIKKLKMEDGIKIAYTIYMQNSSTIKNAFSLPPQK